VGRSFLPLTHKLGEKVGVVHHVVVAVKLGVLVLNGVEAVGAVRDYSLRIIHFLPLLHSFFMYDNVL